MRFCDALANWIKPTSWSRSSHKNLHLGGGTPTILNAGQIKSLMANVFDTLPLSKNAEISVEIDPSEIDTDRVAALAEIGMTRASIGIQDF